MTIKSKNNECGGKLIHKSPREFRKRKEKNYV